VGVHLFEMRKDDIKENPIGRYIQVVGQNFLVKYNGQVETCHIFHKSGHKSVDCEERSDKYWPKFGKIDEKQKSMSKRNSYRQRETFFNEQIAEKPMTLRQKNHKLPSISETMKIEATQPTPSKVTQNWFDQVEDERNSMVSPTPQSLGEGRKRPFEET